MNRMDNLIMANFKLIKRDIIYMILIILTTGMAIWMDYAAGIILIPLMAGMLFMEFKICKRLFYDSIFAESAYLYNSLPVSAEEIVVSRIAVILFSVVIMDVAGMIFLMVNAYFFASKLSDLSALEQVIEYIREMFPMNLEDKTSLGVALMFLRMVSSPTARLSVAFLGVCAYQILSSRKNGEVLKHAAVIAAALFFLFSEEALGAILSFFGITGYIESSVIVVIAMVLVIAAAGAGCIKFLKNHYDVR